MYCSRGTIFITVKRPTGTIIAPPTPCSTRRHHQLVEGVGLGAKQRAGGKQHDGGKEDIPHPHFVRQPAAGRQQHGDRQHVGDDYHMHMQRALPQAFRHGGEGGVDDGRIQRLHKEAEGDYP